MLVVLQTVQYIYGNGVLNNHYLLQEKLDNMQKFKNLHLHKTVINLQLLMEMDYFVFGMLQHNQIFENHFLYFFLFVFYLKEKNLFNLKSQQCHSKCAMDVKFLGQTSSLLITAGQGTNDQNVILWDTLMPQSKSIVHSFVGHHQDGATSVIYLSNNQVFFNFILIFIN